jgi:hypothetical protein
MAGGAPGPTDVEGGGEGADGDDEAVEQNRASGGAALPEAKVVVEGDKR